MLTRFLILFLAIAACSVVPVMAEDTAAIEPPAMAQPPASTDTIIAPVRDGKTTTAREDTAPSASTTASVPSAQQKPVSRRDSVLQGILASIDSSEIPVQDAVPALPVPPEGWRQRLAGFAAVPVGWIKSNLMTVVLTVIAAFLLLLFLIILKRGRSKEKAQRFMTTTRLSLMNGEVQRACLHIENNYGDFALTPASVCAAIVTGQPFLETMFERELGMDIATYIRQVRMHRARQILRWNSSADLQFVAAKVGFRDTGEFEKQFRKVTGSDPETFRNEPTASADAAP